MMLSISENEENFSRDLFNSSPFLISISFIFNQSCHPNVWESSRNESSWEGQTVWLGLRLDKSSIILLNRLKVVQAEESSISVESSSGRLNRCHVTRDYVIYRSLYHKKRITNLILLFTDLLFTESDELFHNYESWIIKILFLFSVFSTWFLSFKPILDDR